MSQDIKNSLASRIGTLSAVVTGSSLVASVFYDWGFFFSIGIGFAEAPTTIADHLRSWLVWLPDAVIAGFLFLLIETLNRRRHITKEAAEDRTSSPDSTLNWVKQSWKSPSYSLIVFLGFSGIIIWLLFGGLITPGIIFAGIICWLVTSRWIFSHPAVNQHYSPLFQGLFLWLPGLLALFFLMGLSSGQSSTVRPKITHKLHIKKSTDITLVEAIMLRHFDRYLVIRTPDDVIRWIQSDNIHFIEQKTKKPSFVGIVCYFQESWCPRTLTSTSEE